MANRIKKSPGKFEKTKNEYPDNKPVKKKKKMQMKDLLLICMAIAAVFIGAWCGIGENKEVKACREQIINLEEENIRLIDEVENLTGQIDTIKSSIKENTDYDGPTVTSTETAKLVHTRNKNLVYPDSYSITIEGVDEDVVINKEKLIRELGDFGYEHGLEISSAKFERMIATNVPKITAFSMSINGNEDEVIDCICYEDDGIIVLYDGVIQLSIDENEESITPTASPTPTPNPTSVPMESTPQNSRENVQTAQIEHIYDPETLSINDIPNGLYEAILDVKEMRDAIYQYMYVNHIYDGVASIDEDYAVIGPYYDFKVIMVNDSRDIYVRYDSRSDKYYCGFNGF